MNQNELQHVGVLGMRWGVRRYQNKNGTLTKEGIRRREKLEGDIRYNKLVTEDYLYRNEWKDIKNVAKYIPNPSNVPVKKVQSDLMKMFKKQLDNTNNIKISDIDVQEENYQKAKKRYKMLIGNPTNLFMLNMDRFQIGMGKGENII